jgi:hypothetical protein
MRHFGLLNGLYERLKVRLLLVTKSMEQKKLSVELYDIAPIFVILAIGIAASVVLLLAEIWLGTCEGLASFLRFRGDLSLRRVRNTEMITSATCGNSPHRP